MNPILPYNKTTRFVTSPLTVLLVTAMLVAATRSQECKQPLSSEPSLADIARALQKQRAKQNLKDVPLYTNDNLPKETGGVGLIGSSNPPSPSASGNENAGSVSKEQDLAYLRYKLNQAQQQLQM